MLWEKIDSIILANYHQYWKNPLVNKYLATKENITPSEEYEGMLILRKKKKPLWISHPFNYAQAKKEFTPATVKTYKTKKELEQLLKKNCGKKTGYDSKYTSISTLKSLKKKVKTRFIDVSKELETEREIKNEEEIEKITLAAEETRKTIAKIIHELKEGQTEKETAKKISEEFNREGLETGFCIVAFGKNTSEIHHISGETKLEKESPVLIDCGAALSGYHADLTTSFWFGEKEDKEYAKTRTQIEQIIQKIEGKLKEGTKANKLWNEAEELKLPHSLGHGIGLEEHDYPKGISEKSNWKLKEGMILAIEPAKYNKNFGIRIENDYIILKKGFRKF